jgi:integrase/recombinase XerC
VNEVRHGSSGRGSGRGSLRGVRTDAPGDIRPAQPRKKQFNPLFLKAEDLDRLFQSLAATSDVRRPRDLAIASLVCLQGLRCNECRMLDREDVRFANQELVIRFAKGGKQRTIPLFPEVAEYVLGWLAERPDDGKPGHEDALFLSKERTRIATRTMRTDAKRWATAADLDPAFHVHTGRHSTAVSLLDAGVSLEGVRDFLGHTNLSVTSIYSHISPERLRREVAKARRT